MLRTRKSTVDSAFRRKAVQGNAGPARAPQRTLIASAVAGCLMLAAPGAFAQSANSNLRGQIAAATEGTEVVATNAATGVVRRTQTDADGSYVLVGLPPGTYIVSAGGATDTVTLSVASNAVLNLEAGAGGGEPIENILVYGAQSTALDVMTSEVGGAISPREIQQLPQATRNFLEFADTVPGMAFETDAQGFTSLRGGATSNNMSNLYIDGVGQKSYVEPGGVAGQNQTRGNPFPQLAIGQYKVITSNYKAEYGQVAGAAVTAVTRSGTNDFEADAYFRYTDESLREERPDEAGGRRGQGRLADRGIRIRHRRTHHPGPPALHPRLRVQGSRHAAQRIAGRPMPRATCSTCRPTCRRCSARRTCPSRKTWSSAS